MKKQIRIVTRLCACFFICPDLESLRKVELGGEGEWNTVGGPHLTPNLQSESQGNWRREKPHQEPLFLKCEVGRWPSQNVPTARLRVNVDNC